MLLEINPVTPSLLLTAIYSLIVLAAGWIVITWQPKIKKTNAIKTYADILAKIRECPTPTALYDFYEECDDFRSRFYTRERGNDIDELYNDLMDEIAQRRFNLVMGKNLSQQV